MSRKYQGFHIQPQLQESLDSTYHNILVILLYLMVSTRCQFFHLYLFLGGGQHNVTAVVMHREVIDEEAGSEEIV